jgi:hypothetical protein
MSTVNQPSEFSKSLITLLSEAFESFKGYFLDPNSSLFETLAEINAAEASIPVGGRCATIAAQVTHVNFAMEVSERYLLTGKNEQYDWGEIWRTVSEVSPEEWSALQNRLRETYQRLCEQIAAHDQWGTESEITEGMNIVVHLAYHLGEIRQAMCIIKK